MLCAFEVGDLLDSVKFPGSKSRRGSCTRLDAARQKVQEVHGGMCCVSFLQRDPSINLRFKLEKLFYKKNSGCYPLQTHGTDHIASPVMPYDSFWMFALYLEHISYTRQVSWLTDHRLLHLLTSLGHAMVLEARSLNTVTSSLRICTWFPLQKMLTKWNRKKHLLHLILQYSITPHQYIRLLLFCQ